MNVEKVAEIFGFSVPETKLIVGVPLRDVLVFSIERAREKYKNSSDDEEEFSALVAWIGFCTTAEQVAEAFRECDNDSPQEALAIKKWVEVACCFEELSELLEMDSDELTKGEWKALFMKALSLCLNTDDANQLYGCVDEENVAEEDLAIDKWLELCDKEGDFSSIEERFDLYDYENEDDEVKERIERIRAFISLSAEKKSNEATDYESAEHAFRIALSDTVAEKIAFMKMISHCSTEQQIIKAYEDVPDEFEEELLPILMKRAYEI